MSHEISIHFALQHEYLLTFCNCKIHKLAMLKDCSVPKNLESWRQLALSQRLKCYNRIKLIYGP